ncbi:MAG: hypothetical protein V3U51_05525 [Thermoplasmata archaeon]
MATGWKYTKTLKISIDLELLEQVREETKGSTQTYRYRPMSGGAFEQGCISRT